MAKSVAELVKAFSQWKFSSGGRMEVGLPLPLLGYRQVDLARLSSSEISARSRGTKQFIVEEPAGIFARHRPSQGSLGSDQVVAVVCPSGDGSVATWLQRFCGMPARSSAEICKRHREAVSGQ